MKKNKYLLIIPFLLIIGIYYYLALPVINIHSPGLWKLILFILLVLLVLYARPYTRVRATGKRTNPVSLDLPWNRLPFKILLGLFGVFFLVYMIGGLLSSPVFNAGKYQRLMTVEKSEFTEDITQISYQQIPLLDKDSAAILGERKMGSLVDLASQFEVADEYTQINYQDNPVRVTPLRYADIIKWFNNRGSGLPGYISIDMATKKTSLIRLKEGMKYSPYDHFGRYLMRHLRFRYPTYIFDDISFN